MFREPGQGGERYREALDYISTVRVRLGGGNMGDCKYEWKKMSRDVKIENEVRILDISTLGFSAADEEKSRIFKLLYESITTRVKHGSMTYNGSPIEATLVDPYKITMTSKSILKKYDSDMAAANDFLEKEGKALIKSYQVEKQYKPYLHLPNFLIQQKITSSKDLFECVNNKDFVKFYEKNYLSKAAAPKPKDL